MNAQSFQVLKRVSGWKAQLSNAQQTQAFSTAAAWPEQEVSLELEVVARACDGYQLRYSARTAEAEVAAGSSYHLSPLAAEEAAATLFGVTRKDWETVPAANQIGAVPTRTSNERDTKPSMPQRVA